MAAKAPREIIEGLHVQCAGVVSQTYADGREAILAQRYDFLADLETWSSVLLDRPENALFEVAQREYIVSMLSLAQGLYRNAFKGLRLVLELYLQGVLLSSDPIGRAEWLRNAKDTYWSSIVDEENGVFTIRFARAFFPQIEERVGAFRGVAKGLYRELSECTHGNVPSAIQLPENIRFDVDVFNTWCEKADTLRPIVHFALAMRYLNELSAGQFSAVETLLLDRLGDINVLRERLGGPI